VIKKAPLAAKLTAAHEPATYRCSLPGLTGFGSCPLHSA